MRKIELLAPAGDFECFKSAINAGADAIYIGGSNFNARINAINFSNEEIKEAIKYAHIHQVKVHVGINISLFEKDLKEVLNFIDFLYVNDVDALIVEDIGLINLILKRYPSLDVHLSTQQNVHNLSQVKFYEQLGVKRIVLSRECDLKTVEYFRSNSNVELEVFAHGALCVCYSGNCYHSSLIGQRSGNRGKCAQPCRMEYTLFKNNRPASEKKYLLSMKDLNTIEYLDKIIESGVSSLKIEGRMKSKEYVYSVVSSYRKAIDNYYSTHSNKIDAKTLKNLTLVFSRQFTKGYLNNEFNDQITNTFRPSHLGELIGKVISSKNNHVQIKLYENIEQKDKIVFVQKEDVSFYLSKIYVKNKLVNKAFKNEIIELEVNSKIENNADVYRCIKNELYEEINQNNQEKKIPVRMKVLANVNEKLVLMLRDFSNHQIVVEGDIVEKAIKSPTSESKIKEQLLKLNNTFYTCNSIKIISNDEVIIPLSKLNELRRQAIIKLDEVRSNFYHRCEAMINKEIYVELPYQKTFQKGLKVQVKNLEQLQAIENLPVDEIYYNDINTYRLAVSKYPNLKITLVLPRIEPQKFNLPKTKKVLIQQIGDYYKYQNLQIAGGLYLNITNSLDLEKLCELNFSSICLSLELNKFDIKQMIDSFKAKHNFLPNIEMVVYGRYENMITKHCFISKNLGFNRLHCNACKSNSFSLVDRKGYNFPISTDNDCNVTIFNSKTTHLIDYVEDIYNMGISSLILNFTLESAEEVLKITNAYLEKIKTGKTNLKLNDVTYGHYNSMDI